MIELSNCKQINRGDFIEFWKDETLIHCLFEDGWKIWFNEKGLLHREDGPAVIKPDGSQFWYSNGELHRLDGAAVIRPNLNIEEYWQRGKKIQ